MHLLVTGATGFIGKRVVHFALAQGHEVSALTRSPETAQTLFGNSVRIVAWDDFLNKDMDLDCDKCIHLAWSDVSNYTEADNRASNLSAQREMIEKIIQSGIKDITITGTCLEYGMREGVCEENASVDAPLPVAYASAKQDLYKDLSQNKDLNLKWLRCFYVYGLGQRPNSLLSMLLTSIEKGDTEFNMSAGLQKRDFIHVDTLAKNIVMISEQDKINGIINVGSGYPITVLDFVNAILKIKSYEIKLNLGHYPYSRHEPMDFWADVTKLRTVQGAVFDGNIWL